MPFELDHVFVCTERGAPLADTLAGAGFEEGAPNTHPGQGTANRRFFFANGFLELVWLADRSEAASPAIRRTRLADRADLSVPASRLGVCLRPTAPGAALPIPTWDYRPPYLPAGAAVPVALDSERPDVPLVFFLPSVFERGGRADAPHPNGARRITAVEASVPVDLARSDALRWLATVPGIAVVDGPAEALSITFDGGARGRALDVAAPTPLSLRW